MGGGGVLGRGPNFLGGGAVRIRVPLHPLRSVPAMPQLMHWGGANMGRQILFGRAGGGLTPLLLPR